MNDEQWVAAVSRLHDPAIESAIVVQCDLHWLRVQRVDLRNAIDEALIAAQLDRGTSLSVTRILLHNLPAAAVSTSEGEAMVRSFAEWNHRLAASSAMLSAPSPRVERVIIGGGDSGAGIPDMVDVQKDGRWGDAPRTDVALRVIGSPGATTPLTSYDVVLSGPFSDSDPSVHM